MTITPARVAAILTALSGVAGAIAVPAANIDTKDAKSVWIGVGSCVVAGVTFLIGNSRWEVATAKAAKAAKATPPASAPTYSYTGATTGYTTSNVSAASGSGLIAAGWPSNTAFDGPSDPAVPAVEGPPADPDEDTNVPTPNPKLGKPELDDPDWKPKKR